MENSKLFLIKKIKKYLEIFTTTVVSIFFKKFDKKKYQFSFQEVWYSPHIVNNDFNLIYSKINRYTLISKKKLFCLFNISKQISKLNGSFLEIGTLRGGSAALLASNLLSNELILWDRWGDKITSVEKDNYFIKKKYAEEDDLLTSKNLIKKFTNKKVSLVYKNISFPNKKIINSLDNNLSLVHFDIYDKDAFNDGIKLIWPKMIKGGVFIVSAYGSISLDLLTDAVNYYVKKKHDCLFFQTFSGMALLIKI